LSEEKKHRIENHIAPGSGANLTPFGKGGRAVELEVSAAVKVTFLVKMVVDRRLNRGELL
jgi:hypothetical protein